MSTDRLASSDCRGYVSAVMSVMGDRAEMSCTCERGLQSHWIYCQRTNDRLYESKLSREMLNGSVSANRLRWFEDVVETLDLECQKVGFSCCGDG